MLFDHSHLISHFSQVTVENVPTSTNVRLVHTCAIKMPVVRTMMGRIRANVISDMKVELSYLILLIQNKNYGTREAKIIS